MHITQSLRVIHFLCLVPVSAFLLSGCGEQAQEKKPVVRPVKTMVLGEASSEFQRTFTAKVRAADRVELAFQVPGKIIELPVKKGQQVSQGDLIGRLDQRDYKSNLKSAKAEHVTALANFKRGDELVGKGFISKTDYDRLRARRDVSRAELDKAKKALEDTELKAPFDGAVAQRFVENFTEVRAKQKIVSLQDTSLLELVVYIPEHIVALSRQEGPREEAKIFAEFNAIPGEQFPLTIKEFSTQADATTQTFEYVLTMPLPEGRNILPGMTANVTASRGVDKSQGTTSFSIPAIAVFADEKSQSHVWVVKQPENTVHAREVTTGNLSGADQIEILAGIESGEMIAIAGVSQLREGMQVRPVDRIDF